MFGRISIINEGRIFLIALLYYFLIILLCPQQPDRFRGLDSRYSLFVKGLLIYHFQKAPPRERQGFPRLVREDQVHQIYELKL